jgi:hypothetical protein
MKGCPILWKAFSVSIEMILWFLSLFLLICILHLMICIYWTIPAFLVYDLFDKLLNFVCQYFIEDFCTYVHWRDWPVILFHVVVVSFSGFGTSVILAS